MVKNRSVKETGIITDVPNAARNYKDRIFRMVFREKKALLALYNAMNETDYENEDDLKVTTLESALYLEMKNDVSFGLYDELLLYEHQSTKNPNLPLRNLFYVSDVYSELTKDLFLYGSVPVQIPEPKFVVFYNGLENMQEREVLKLSSLYAKKAEHISLELETLVLNVNVGYNKILMERCRQLSDYAQFVSEVRKRLSKKIPLSEAVNEAVEDCIQRGILAEFLSKNRAEVIKVSIYEYDEEKVKRMFKEECMKLGMEQGKQLGIEQGKQIGIEQGIEQARVIFRLYISGKSEEDIARETGETIEMIHKVLKG
jgi:predicted transposase YdaD